MHASETIGASNCLSSRGQHYDPVAMLAAAAPPDEGIRSRLRFQQERLERSERITRESNRRLAYFRPRDVELLKAICAKIATRSATLGRAERDRALIAAERQRMVESVSPEWRALFDALFDAKHPTQEGTREAEEQAVLDLPEYKPVAALPDAVRGKVLHEATLMHHKIAEMRRRKAEIRPGLEVGSAPGEIGHPVAAGVLGGLATVLLERPVTCDDASMAELIDQAITWRPLCQPGLLDSAQRTLAAGPAPRTEAALGRLAVRPSHCFVPSRDYGDYEGDGWWQDTPGRVATMLAGRNPPRGGRSSGRMGFGRRQNGP